MSDITYSPKLRRVIDQIDKILQDEGICGAVMLYDNDLKITEYSLKSLAHKDNVIDITDGQFHLTNKDIRTKEEKKKRIDTTANMLISLQDLCGNYYMAFDNILDEIKKKFAVTIKRQTHTKRGGPTESN